MWVHEDTHLDASSREGGDGLGYPVLQAVLHSCGPEQGEVCFYGLCLCCHCLFSALEGYSGFMVAAAPQLQQQHAHVSFAVDQSSGPGSEGGGRGGGGRRGGRGGHFLLLLWVEVICDALSCWAVCAWLAAITRIQQFGDAQAESTLSAVSFLSRRRSYAYLGKGGR